MKKLMTVIAAAAMSFGLFAEGEVLKHGNSFEAGDQNVSDDGKTFTTDQTVWTAGDEAATFNIGTYDGDAYTGYGAEGTPTARRDDEFVAEDTNSKYLKLEDGSVTLSRVVSDNSIFVDQLVKFSGFDEVPVIEDGAKIAIWKAAIEDDDGEVTDGCLYVAVGDGLGNVKNVRLMGTYENDTWYRLTIRDDGEVSTEDAGEAGFVIYIDGVQAQIVEDDRAYRTDGGDGLKNTAKNLYKSGKLFTSIGTKLTSFGIASVGYKGIGAIDDVIIDSVGPEFAAAEITATIAAVTGATLTGVKDADDEPITFEGGGPYTFSIAPGSTVTLTFEPAEGYSFKGDAEQTVTVMDENEIDVSDELQAFEVFATKVNDQTTTKYGEDELYAMITSLVDGDTVTFNKAAEIYDDTNPDPLYVIDVDTTIEVDVADDDSISWTVTVPGEAGSFTDNVGAEAFLTKEFKFSENENGMLVLGGDVAGMIIAETVEATAVINVSGILTADELSIDESIQLVDNGQVITKDGTLTVNEIIPVDGKVLDKTQLPETEYYVYTSVDPEPEIEYVTFTAAFPSFFSDVTFKTNGEEVVFTDDKYTVESNAVVTIAYTLDPDYKDAVITYGKASDPLDSDILEGDTFTATNAVGIVGFTAVQKDYKVSVNEVKYEDVQDALTAIGQLAQQSKFPIAVTALVDNLEFAYNNQKAIFDEADEELIIDNYMMNWTFNGAVSFTGTVSGLLEATDITVIEDGITINENGTVKVLETSALTTADFKSGKAEFEVKVTTEDGKKIFTIGPVASPYPGWLPDDPVAQGKYDQWSKKTCPVGDDPLPDADLQDAFLLNCDPGVNALAAARAEFKVTSITQDSSGNWVVKVTGEVGQDGEYGNGFVDIISVKETKFPTAGEASDFFQAKLVMQLEN